MSLFDHKRLRPDMLRLDAEGLRRGWYSDKYFENVVRVLEGARRSGYRFAGDSTRIPSLDNVPVAVGELVVEAQVFNRRAPSALVAGVDVSLAMLRLAAGIYEDDQFVEAWQRLDVEAVEDGVFTHYEGNTEDVEPVVKIRGRYSDFALLETPILGVLTRASRLATNAYRVLSAARGKTVLFMPARFDLPEVQPADGYAFWLAVQRYNFDTGHKVPAMVSANAQGAWWGGRGSGTIPHALIACFMADTAETMLAFAEHIPLDVPRIALVDFNNDCVGAALATLKVYWPHYLDALRASDLDGQKRWTLYGVRLDTSPNMRDVSLGPGEGYGVNPTLVRTVREALDNAWREWDVPQNLLETAQAYCRNVRIVVSGGFNHHKIEQFEAQGVPVDIYGVGSTLLRNDSETNTDFTMDVVRILLDGQWVDMAKVGRKPNTNPDLKPVDLSML